MNPRIPTKRNTAPTSMATVWIGERSRMCPLLWWTRSVPLLRPNCDFDHRIRQYPLNRFIQLMRNARATATRAAAPSTASSRRWRARTSCIRGPGTASRGSEASPSRRIDAASSATSNGSIARAVFSTLVASTPECKFDARGASPAAAPCCGAGAAGRRVSCCAVAGAAPASADVAVPAAADAVALAPRQVFAARRACSSSREGAGPSTMTSLTRRTTAPAAVRSESRYVPGVSCRLSTTPAKRTWLTPAWPLTVNRPTPTHAGDSSLTVKTTGPVSCSTNVRVVVRRFFAPLAPIHDRDEWKWSTLTDLAEEPREGAEAEPSPLPAAGELDAPLKEPVGSAGFSREAAGTLGAEALAGGTTAGAGGLGAAGRGTGTGRGGTVTVGAGGRGGTGGAGTGLAAAEPATTAAAAAAMTPPSVLTPPQLRRAGIGCASGVIGKNPERWPSPSVTITRCSASSATPTPTPSGARFTGSRVTGTRTSRRRRTPRSASA